MALRDWLSQISIPVYILVMLFAIASWIDINGLWVELPLLVNELPEGWNLPSYLAVIIQIANIGPLTYTIANRLAPNKVKEWPVIYIIIMVGAASCLLLAFFWKETSIIAGAEHSTALILFASLLAFVDCTSSVVFLPFMAEFKPQYMTALYVGEGLSGLIPGLVGLVQSVSSDPICVNTSVIIHNKTTGENYTKWEIIPEYGAPVFSVQVFFFFLFSIMVVSGVAFSLLQWLPYCRNERLQINLSDVDSNHIGYTQTKGKASSECSSSNNDTFNEVNSSTDQIPHLSKEPLQPSRTAPPPTDRDQDGRDHTVPRLGTATFILLLVIIAWLNCLTNGIMASIQSYSSLPYGSLAYTLAVRLSAVANPLACFLALFVVCKSVRVVGILTIIASVLAGYQIYCAAASPYPPFVGTEFGIFLSVSAILYFST